MKLLHAAPFALLVACQAQLGLNGLTTGTPSQTSSASGGGGSGSAAAPSAAESADDAMAKIAVETRLGMQREDSANLAKVADAFERATPDMRVQVKDPNVGSGFGAFEWVPAPFDSYGFPTQFAAGSERKGPLAALGGDFIPKISTDGADVEFARFGDFPARLALGTPGLVWRRGSSNCTFVTTDGGIYLVECRMLAAGTPPVASWPQPLQHTLLSPADLKRLVQIKAIPAQAEEPFERAKGEWDACVKKVGAPSKAEFAAIDQADILETTRQNRRRAVVEKYREKQEASCKAGYDKMVAAFVKVIEDRNTDRKALNEKVKAKWGK